MHRRRHADARFEHAADHAVHPVERGEIGGEDGAGQPAGLHQLDVDDVGGAHSHQVQHFLRPEHAFIGHHRGVDALGDVLEALEVACLHRLFEQFQADAGVLQRVHGVHRLFRGPALVGIKAQQGAVPDRGVDRLDPLHVQPDVLAHLDLERAEAALDRGKRLGHHLVDVVHADGDVGADDRLAAAQHLVERCAVVLAPQVVERDFHRRLGAGVALQRGLDQAHRVVEVGHLLADQARADEVADGLDDRAVGVAGDHRRGRRLAVADLAGVGVQGHDDVFDGLDRAQRGLERGFQRDADAAQREVGDFHRGETRRMRWML